MHTRTDAELMALARSGSLVAATELFQRHQESARRVARSIAPGFEDDAVNTAYQAITGAFTSGAGPNQNYRAYLNTTVRNIARKHLVTRGREVHVNQEQLEIHLARGGEGRGPIYTVTQRAAVAAAFRGLPPNWKTVLWQVEVLGLSVTEAARMMGVSYGTATSMLRRARVGLRRAYNAPPRRRR